MRSRTGLCKESMNDVYRLPSCRLWRKFLLCWIADAYDTDNYNDDDDDNVNNGDDGDDNDDDGDDNDDGAVFNCTTLLYCVVGEQKMISIEILV